jgi:hypothetical protein
MAAAAAAAAVVVVVVMVMINTFLVKKYIFATQMNNVYLPS